MNRATVDMYVAFAQPERLCRNLGLEKKGRAGWKMLVSAGERG